MAFALLGIAGYFGHRAWDRASERQAALALAERGPAQEALPALLRCLDRQPEHPELLRAIVRTQIKAGALFADVEPFTQRWCQASPDDPEPFRVRADLLLRLSRFSEALVAAKRAAELSPDEANKATLARLYLVSGQFADATRAFRELLAEQPTNSGYALALTRAEWELGNHAEAARLAEDSLRQRPNDPATLLLRGLIHFRCGEYEPALATFARVRPSNDQEHVTLLYHRAQVLDRLGRTAEAKVAFAQLMAVQNAARFVTDAEQRPEDMAIQVRASEALLAAGRAEQALRLLESAIARLGASRAALTVQAACHDALGRPDLAQRARNAAEASP